MKRKHKHILEVSSDTLDLVTTNTFLKQWKGFVTEQKWNIIKKKSKKRKKKKKEPTFGQTGKQQVVVGFSMVLNQIRIFR